jgi:hypothetical protein
MSESTPVNRERCIRPLFFTNIEGTQWKPWLGESVSLRQLNNWLVHTRHTNKTTFILNQGGQKYTVHSFEFYDGARWDCINGWAQELAGE